MLKLIFPKVFNLGLQKIKIVRLSESVRQCSEVKRSDH